MTAHGELCDGFYYVGKGNLPNPDDDSVHCAGQCLEPDAWEDDIPFPVVTAHSAEPQSPQEIAQVRADEHGKVVRAYEMGGSVTYWVGAAPGSRQYNLIAEAFPTKDESQ
jgi:hypothetical protein